MVVARYAPSFLLQHSYHVFLSFRGRDTRWGFTDHLYRALVQAGIRTFRDEDEIKRGENIESELDKAIKESQVSIIVFSQDYASSRWCLDELVKILERRNTDPRHVILPVFYDVDPSDVRKQSGSFAEAFARHEKQTGSFTLATHLRALSRKEMDKVEQWRKALRCVASLKGMVLDGYERHFIQKIVKEVKDKLAALGAAPFPVGMDNVARVPNTRPHALAYVSNDGIGNGTTIARAQGSNSLALIHGAGGIGNGTAIARAQGRDAQGSNSLALIHGTGGIGNGTAIARAQTGGIGNGTTIARAQGSNCLALIHGTGGIGNGTTIARAQGSNSLAEVLYFQDNLMLDW